MQAFIAIAYISYMFFITEIIFIAKKHIILNILSFYIQK